MAKKAKPKAAGSSAKTKSSAKPPSKFSLHVHSNGAVEVQRDKKGILHIRTYSSAAEALAAGVDGRVVKLLFKAKGGRPTPPDCETVGSPDRGRVWMRCVDHDCTGEEGCHLFSWPRNNPDDFRDEGKGGRWAQPGRIYECTCVYSA